MKKHIAPLFIAFVLLASCKGNMEKETNTDYKHSLDSLYNVLTDRDSSINDLLKSFNRIEENLDSVAKRQNIISFDINKQQNELRSETKNRISSQIAAINELMEQNKKQIETLNQKLKRSSFRIHEFQKIITTLNDQITQKNTELAALNERLQALNAQMTQLQISVDTLSTANYEQSELIAAQTASIHTAYYIVGNSKELIKMKVINKDGGLLGIGKTPKLSPEFDTEYFKRVDYTQVLSIPIYSKKAKVITTHPLDSYILDMDENSQYTTLRIIMPEKFWSASKYLVIINS